MYRRVVSITMFSLLLSLTASTGWTQRSYKTQSVSSVGSSLTVGTSSVTSFNSYAASASSYGNLYSAPPGGGALSSSIQEINRQTVRSGGSGAPMSAFGGGSVGASKMTTRNISAGALPSLSFGKAAPVPGGETPVLAGPGAAPSATTGAPSAAFSSGEENLPENLSMSAEESGLAYAAVFGSARTTEKKNGDNAITSLEPKHGGSRRYRQLIHEGEEAFRQEDYRQAAQAFEIAREISSDSSESLLSLMHVHFATARNEYNMPALYLQRVLRDVPELPLISVHPRDFYGNVGTFVKDMLRMEDYLKTKPNDANAQFVMAYMKWREEKPDQAVAALRKAKENCTNNEELDDAIRTFWKAMVYRGAASGTLEDHPAAVQSGLLPEVPPVSPSE